MKIQLLRWVLLALYLLGLSTAYGQGIKWGSGPANYQFSGTSVGYQVVIDASGNTYVAGTGGYSIAFDDLLPRPSAGPAASSFSSATPAVSRCGYCAAVAARVRRWPWPWTGPASRW
ncbi:hypothetical protein [Hymenobacter sp. BRD67]|uniref:hypothetical protein n=1 Tax=Hymenobacter sp. BRD67 TaxID=2675877 RepID=UPI001564B6C6|nr:hypothetical protein [Hymenobacter sp. BRD67]QKG51855.1 hypothetical protein GKZ67_03580 [Hymenobacter sp. BRD67]